MGVDESEKSFVEFQASCLEGAHMIEVPYRK